MKNLQDRIKPRMGRFATLAFAASLCAAARAQVTTGWYVYRIQPLSQNNVPTNAWLTDWNTDFGSDAGSLYPSGFVSGDATASGVTAAYPVALFGGYKVKLDVGLYFYNRKDNVYTARGYLGRNQIIIPNC